MYRVIILPFCEQVSYIYAPRLDLVPFVLFSSVSGIFDDLKFSGSSHC